jgi:hypothetical protein
MTAIQRTPQDIENAQGHEQIATTRLKHQQRPSEKEG